MIAASGKRIILVYARQDDGWRQRLEERLVARANDRERFPAGLSVEAWSDEYLAESARAPDTLRDEFENVAIMLFLVSDDLLGSPCVRDESIAGVLQSILLEERSVSHVFRVLVRLSTYFPGWLALLPAIAATQDQALADFPPSLCDAELDRIADMVASLADTQGKVEMAPGGDSNSLNVDGRNEATASNQATEQPSAQTPGQPNRPLTKGASVKSRQSRRQPESPAPSATGTVPLARLSEFKTASSIPFLMNRAAEMASGVTPPIAVTTSFMLLAFAEATDTGGPWTAHFLRELIDRHTKEYDAIRDRYFRKRGSRGLQARSESPVRSLPVEMTGYLFAALERSRDIAQRTTHDPEIHARHLLAALLHSDTTQERSGALNRLAEMNLDPVFVREALCEWLRGHGDDDDAWEALLIGTRSAVRRFSGFIADRVGGDDLLDIQNDVRALAALIAARTVVPPLSIGLFGEWGSGKTFFMRQLRAAIDGLAAEARVANRMQRDLPIYKNIVQIEFNAWHYVEGNLWASLVEHILDNLYAKEDPRISRALQEELIKKLAEEKALSQATSNAADSAKAAATAAKVTLDAAQKSLNEKTEELAQLNAEHVRKDFVLTGAHQPVVDALEQLNLGAVGRSAVELEGALRQIHGVLGRGQRFLAPLMHAKDRNRRFNWLLLSLLGAPVMAIIMRFVLQMLGSSVTDIYAYATGLATLIASGVPWLKQQAQWMSRRLDEAETAQKKFDEEMAKETAVHVQKVTQAEQRLRELTAALDSAQQRHAEAKAREAAADAELKAATAGRLLANFITDRAASSDYRKHLGVLALVRDDFEKLSGLIEEENWSLSPEDPSEPPRADGQRRYASLAEEEKDKDKRINRIVLYIDDLDRCPPNKVVEVLQAVHLLLAFPLFVVVVGVDARWIKRSLQTRYRELLHVDNRPVNDDGDTGLLLGSATPNDYLEKIFQIPFWLRPMDAAACDNMVRGLLRTSVKHSNQDSKEGGQDKGAGKITMPVAEAGTSPGIPVTPQQRMSGASAPAATQARQQQAAQSAPPGSASAGSNAGATPVPAAQPPAYPTFESLEIIPAELDFMTKLAPVLGRSPRALKRFVNVYRLIKVGLGPHEERSFLRPGNPLGHYQAVLLLLAVDTGTPMLARNFFATVEVGAGSEPLNEAARDIGWLMKEMDQAWLEDAPGWQRLRKWLEVHDEEVPADTRLAVLAPWTKRVARFSFEVGRS
ncbi:hypothetical protein EBAPG3_008960 [Nitrosospira lacus]|uniref:KAP NTPase domain-containing protein n=1 Tax=Nitrosospira lacus TaxID=1288494 RepID=A0A1W6SQ09_9PROT|nr:P-loop NTPase fold protein [Nitrosospira lacus]ARO87886.1 hypothetical protein EBAPG3_008960 [Nitrosospira lacus]